MNIHSIFISILISGLNTNAQTLDKNTVNMLGFEVTRKMIVLSTESEDRDLINRFLTDGSDNLTKEEVAKVESILKRLNKELEKTQPMMTRE